MEVKFRIHKDAIVRLFFWNNLQLLKVWTQVCNTDLDTCISMLHWKLKIFESLFSPTALLSKGTVSISNWLRIAFELDGTFCIFFPVLLHSLKFLYIWFRMFIIILISRICLRTSPLYSLCHMLSSKLKPCSSLV